jgi:hypothetical protein
MKSIADSLKLTVATIQAGQEKSVNSEKIMQDILSKLDAIAMKIK